VRPSAEPPRLDRRRMVRRRRDRQAIRARQRRFKLIAENPAYEPIVTSNVSLVGVVRGVIRLFADSA